MPTKNDERTAADPSADPQLALRKRAEEKAGAAGDPKLQNLSPAEAGRLFHELRVHQIELEMQNEELRRTQEGLEASRARYFDLYDLAPVGYFTICEKGLILEANLTAATLLGVPRSALIKKPLSRSIVPEDQDIHYRHFKHLFETGERQVYELRMARQDGAPFWARLEAIAAQDGESGATICRATMSDITKRKKAEEELTESEERYRNLFENMREGFAYCRMIYDELGHPVDFVYLKVNQAFTKLTNLHDVVGKRVTEVIPAIRDLYPELFKAYGRVASSGQPEKFEINFGVLGIWLDLSVFSPAEGHFIAVFADITERKRAEEERDRLLESLRKAGALLEKRVEERTAELSRKNDELQDFAFVASHDMREPIRKIQTFGGMIRDNFGGILPDQGKDY